jgi:ribulose 1,5-bisphosphate synthetase/thiazole synthase
MPPERPAVICDPFDLYGRHLARSILRSRVMGETSSSTIPQLSTTQRPRLVGILGAGMTGLYTALLLAKAEIPFQILEATDRVGGRCYTHHFEGGGKWDYYVSRRPQGVNVLTF